MKLFNMIFLLAGLAVFTSCEDIIDLELDNTEARVIIEANVNATDQNITVIISESNDFYQVADQILITDANVFITYKNQSIPLSLNDSGFFYKEGLNLEEGDEISLLVEVLEEKYEATTVVPFRSALIAIDSLEFAVPIGPGMNSNNYQIFSTWQDLQGEVNYYRLRSYSNEEYNTGTYFLMSDDGFDGREITRPIQQAFEAGSKVTMELLSTDRSYYNYYLQLSSTQSAGLSSAIPFNPSGNFSNGALGYFGAYHTSSLTIQL